jgi:hypothetical protein
MRASRLVAAAILVAAAVLLALFASDLRAWEKTMRADDLRLALEERAAPAWRADTVLPSGLSRRLLGLDDDRDLRQAVAAFRAAERAQGPAATGFVRRHLRSDAETALGEVVVERGHPREASQASNLAGILAFAETASGGRAAPPIERSVGAFQAAVRLDPSNGAAKANLELLLRLLQARGQRVGPNPAPGPRGGGRRGAGSSTPGHGY